MFLDFFNIRLLYVQKYTEITILTTNSKIFHSLRYITFYVHSIQTVQHSTPTDHQNLPSSLSGHFYNITMCWYDGMGMLMDWILLLLLLPSRYRSPSSLKCRFRSSLLNFLGPHSFQCKLWDDRWRSYRRRQSTLCPRRLYPR